MKKKVMLRKFGKLYIKEANDCIYRIKASLNYLEKNMYDERAVIQLRMDSHKLKGSSLQMGFYLIAYLARLIEDIVKKILEKELKLNKQKLEFLKDFCESLEKAVDAETRKKKFRINPKLIDTMDKLLEKEYKRS